MRMNASKLLMGLMLVSTLSLWGCFGKWKQTTQMDFRYELVKTNEEVPFLQINQGTISLKQIDWEGLREQSGDVQFEEEFETSMLINAGVDNGPVEISYDIPQGTYTQINMDLRLDGSTDLSQSIYLTGDYVLSGGSSIPFVFETLNTFDIELKTLFPNGDPDISFIKGDKRIATIRLHLIDWFGNTTENMFRSADLKEVGGKETIVISPNDNLNIYDAVIGRIGQIDILDLN